MPYNHDDFELEKHFIREGTYYDVPHLDKKLFKNVLLNISSSYFESYSDEVIKKTTLMPMENPDEHRER